MFPNELYTTPGFDGGMGLLFNLENVREINALFDAELNTLHAPHLSNERAKPSEQFDRHHCEFCVVTRVVLNKLKLQAHSISWR